LVCWADNGTNGARYYSYSETSGSAPVYTYFDAHGRELKKESKGLNDQTIRTFTEYYSDGRLKRKSEPTFGTAAQTWAEAYTYNSYGQVETIITPSGLTSYSQPFLLPISQTTDVRF
jgi:YD repeat-containing protein